MKGLNKNQKWYFQQIMKLGKDKKVIKMSYDELYLTLDRIKFCYFLSYISLNKKLVKELTKTFDKYQK